VIEAAVLIERQVPLLLTFKKTALDCGYRVDLVVDRRVVVELKSVVRLLAIHEAQLPTYLRLGGKLKEDIMRRVL
jgi:GxxExxY protein